MAINELTDKRYHGKVCSRHPEFNGLRAKSSNLCVQCLTEKKAKTVSRGTKTEVERVQDVIDQLKRQIDAMQAAFHVKRQPKLDEIKRLTEYHEKLISESI